MGAYKSHLAQDNDLVTRDSAGTTNLVITSTGLVYSQGVPVKSPILADATTSFNPYSVDTVTWSSLGLSASTTPAYGITYINANSAAGDPSTSPALLTLAAPITGVKKTVILDTTAAYINTIDLYLGGGTIIGTSGDDYILFSSLGEVTQSVTLIGISTALWGVEAVNSTLLFYGAATGIRGATAARTS